jgi:hypothetical protein
MPDLGCKLFMLQVQCIVKVYKHSTLYRHSIGFLHQVYNCLTYRTDRNNVIICYLSDCVFGMVLVFKFSNRDHLIKEKPWGVYI